MNMLQSLQPLQSIQLIRSIQQFQADPFLLLVVLLLAAFAAVVVWAIREDSKKEDLPPQCNECGGSGGCPPSCANYARRYKDKNK